MSVTVTDCNMFCEAALLLSNFLFCAKTQSLTDVIVFCCRQKHRPMIFSTAQMSRPFSNFVDGSVKRRHSKKSAKGELSAGLSDIWTCLTGLCPLILKVMSADLGLYVGKYLGSHHTLLQLVNPGGSLLCICVLHNIRPTNTCSKVFTWTLAVL